MSDATRDPVYYGPMACCGEVHGGWESPCPTLVKLREAVSRYGSDSEDYPTWGVRIGDMGEWARVCATAFPTPDHLVRHREHVILHGDPGAPTPLGVLLGSDMVETRPTLNRFAPHDDCAPDCQAPDAPAHKPALGSPPAICPDCPHRLAEHPAGRCERCACGVPAIPSAPERNS